MATARIFMNGNSQAVRLPKDFRFDSDEVEILRRGDEVVLRQKGENLKQTFELLTEMPEDVFDDDRQNPPPETRESL